LTERHVGALQQLTRDLKPDLIGHLPESEALGAKVPVQRAAMHREQAGNGGSGASVFEQLGPKQSPQVFGKGAGAMAAR
jgi:hypothetical protein